MAKLLKQRLAALFMTAYRLTGFRVQHFARASDISGLGSIAIFSTTALGDLLLNTPAIAAIRKQYPAAKIVLVVNRRNAQLVDGSAMFDDILFWNGKLNGVRALARALRKKKLDATFILHSRAPYDILTATLARSTFIFKDVYYNDYQGQPYFALRRFLSFHYDHRNDGDLPLIQKKWDLLSQLGIDASPEMIIPAPYQPEVRNRRALGVHLGASSEERCWPIERFVLVLRQVLQDYPDVDIELLGGGGEVERNRRLIALLGDVGERITDFAGRTSLIQLTEKIASLSCLLIGDTGPMHIAIAVRTPVVALFPSPLAAGGTRPQQDEEIHQVLIAHSERDDMTALGVDEVSAALHKALSR